MRFNQSPARLQGGITDLKKVILKRSRLSFGSRLSLLAIILGETGLTSVGDPPPPLIKLLLRGAAKLLSLLAFLFELL